VDAGLVDVDVIAETARLVEDVAADLPAIGRPVRKALREAISRSRAGAGIPTTKRGRS
jgi:hypothetical protein